MASMMPFRLALVATVAASALAPAVLRWTPKVGEVARFKVDLTAQASGSTFKAGGTLKETTKSVAADRVVLTVDRDLSVLGADGKRQMLPPSPETIVLRPDGSLVDVDSEKAAEDAFRSSRLTQFVFPTKPVETGVSWQLELPVDKNASDTGVRLFYTVAGEERVGDKDAWKVVSRGGETGKGKTAVEAMFWIDKATGSRLRVHSYITGAAFPGTDGRSIDLEEDIVRQP